MYVNEGVPDVHKRMQMAIMARDVELLSMRSRTIHKFGFQATRPNTLSSSFYRQSTPSPLKPFTFMVSGFSLRAWMK